MPQLVTSTRLSADSIAPTEGRGLRTRICIAFVLTSALPRTLLGPAEVSPCLRISSYAGWTYSKARGEGRQWADVPPGLPLRRDALIITAPNATVRIRGFTGIWSGCGHLRQPAVFEFMAFAHFKRSLRLMACPRTVGSTGFQYWLLDSATFTATQTRTKTRHASLLQVRPPATARVVEPVRRAIAGRSAVNPA